MKKSYTKPSAYIQDMSVNCFVAGACEEAGAMVLGFSEDECTYYDPASNMTFFSHQCEDTTGFGVDIINPNPASPFAQLCYHRPLDVSQFFSS